MSGALGLGRADASLEGLVAFSYRVADQGLPEAVRAHLELLLADSLACAAAGASARPARQAAALERRISGAAGACALVGRDTTTTPEAAALINGVAIRCLELNDTYLGQEPVHPSDVTAALLALAQWRGRDGRRLLTALATAYELLAFLCDSVAIRERGWDTVTLGGIAIAVAGAPLIGLDPAAALEAARLAAITAPALAQTRIGALCAWKNVSFAHAGRNAVFLLAAAEAGISGPVEALDGRAGLGSIVLGSIDPRSAAEPWRCLRTRIKMHASQYFTHPAIDAALAVRSRVLAELDTIRRITVRTFDVAVRTAADSPDKWSPTSAETADHSLPHCVAAALLDGRITPAQFGTERREDARLGRLRDTIAVREEPEYTRRYPSRTPTAIAIELDGGAVVKASVPDLRGDLTIADGVADAEEKLRTVLGYALGADSERVDGALRAVRAVPRSLDLSAAVADLNAALITEPADA